MISPDEIEKIKYLPEDEQGFVLRSVLSEVYKKSLYKTCKNLLGYEQVNLRTHGGIIDALESDSKRKLIVVPRGTFKSTIGVVGYCVWRLINDPDLRILIDSELYTNSKNFLREIKTHLMTDRVTNVFGTFQTDHTWNESEIIIKQRTRNLKESSITCSGIGATKVSQHYDVIIMDDMNSNNNSLTVDGRRKVIDHYKLNYSILEPHGVLVVIGTRYSDDDLIGWIMKTEIEDA